MGLDASTVSLTLQSALAHHEAGRLADAEALYRQVLYDNPFNPDALNLLGQLSQKRGEHSLAVSLIGQAASVCPQVPYFRLTLANALRAAGRVQEAAEGYRLANQLAGGDADALNNLGDLLREMGQFSQAVIACRKAIELNENFPLAWNNLGCALREMGEFDEAADACRRAVALKPDYAEAYTTLGACLQQSGRVAEAIDAYRSSLEINPTLALTWNNLTFALMEQGRADEALEAAEHAVSLSPRCVEAHNARAYALKHLGQLEESVAELRAALEIDPRNQAIWGNLLVTLHCFESDGQVILREHMEWYRRCAQPLADQIRPHMNGRQRDRRVRVGYVSADFRRHPVGMFLEPLLEQHDRAAFEIFCYCDVLKEDDLTAKLRCHADAWRNIVRLSDAQLAEQVRADAIDILVDLAVHTTRNRMLTFARKPAPVQLTYLGYPSTTGLTSVDFRTSDEHLEQAGSENSYVEPALPLAGGYFCLTPRPAAPDVAPLPALKNEFVTFGSLNLIKAGRAALEVWRELLKSVPGAHLLLHAHRGSHRGRLRDHFAQAGVSGERIEFVDSQPYADYLATYNRIDIALDSFPYCGGTTSCDALWMGVPVVTLAGQTGVQRLGVSILRNAGLANLIAETKEQYVQIARDLASDVEKLAGTRAQMRAQLLRSPLMDAARHARGVEAALRTAWQRWCDSADVK